MSEEQHGSLSSVLVFIIVRVLYFIGCFFCLAVGAAFFLGGGSSRRAVLNASDSGVSVAGSLLFMPELWIVMAILSAVGAIFGPSLYHRHTMRGRGTLKDIKEDGWYDGE